MSDKTPPPFTLYDFSKELEKREKDLDEQEDQNPDIEILLSLYMRCRIAFKAIPSDIDYGIASTRLREAFMLALNYVNLDEIDFIIDSAEEIYLEEDVKEDANEDEDIEE